MTEPPIHTGPDEVQAHPHKTGHSKLDLVIAISAIFISAVSLIVAVEHGRTERDLVAANTWPFLQGLLNNGSNDGKDIAIGVSNGGVGPAKLHTIELFFQGKPVTSPFDLLRQCCGLGRTSAEIRKQLPGGMIRSIADETVLRPGEENQIIAVHHNPAAPEIPDRLTASLLKISFRACYCSVLDECWQSDLRSTRTRRVRSCPAPEHPFNPLGE